MNNEVVMKRFYIVFNINFYVYVAAPGEVYQPQCSSTSLLTYILTWKQPCRLNGILKQFKVIVIGTRDKHSDDRFSYSIMPNLSVGLK